jgi:hypothetical protein
VNLIFAWLLVTILLAAMTHTVMAGMEIQRLSLMVLIQFHLQLKAVANHGHLQFLFLLLVVQMVNLTVVMAIAFLAHGNVTVGQTVVMAVMKLDVLLPNVLIVHMTGQRTAQNAVIQRLLHLV